MVAIPKKGELLLYFSAEWCGPCKNFYPLLTKVCELGELPVQKILVDEEPEFTYSQQVRSVPTIKLFRDGQIVGTAIGAMSESQLKDWLNSNS